MIAMMYPIAWFAGALLQWLDAMVPANAPDDADVDIHDERNNAPWFLLPPI
jgi:hypothetical protein